MMKLLNFTRYSEWWEYKLVPLVSLGYAAIYLSANTFNAAVIHLLLILLAVISGAIYVSVINDLTDIKEDAIAGKSNRMADKPVWFRILILGICIVAALFFGYALYPDAVSIFLYAMSYIVFTLYSVPPFRLKKRSLWGVICDGSGAHFFPALLVTYSLCTFTHAIMNWEWFAAVSMWALMYGLRGILWHQFYDRDNDLASSTTTFATRIDPQKFGIAEKVLFIVELGAFLLMLSYLYNTWILLSVLAYLLLVAIRIKSFGYKTTIVISPKNYPYQLLLNDYYLVFFPLALLITNAIANNTGWIVLIVHLLLFPQKTLLVMKDFMIFFRSKIRKQLH
ncbi:MAG: UbiA family prenyltransferase [Mucilaginibacter sp.]